MRINKIILLLPLLFFVSCSTTKLIKEGEYLYQDSDVEVKSTDDENVKSVEKQLNKVADLEKNRKLFGFIPFRLWMYNLAGDSVPDKGFRHWLKYKVGEPPVIFRNYTIDATREELGNVLKNNGYYNYDIETKKETENRKIRLKYNVEVQHSYHFGPLRFPAVEDSLTAHIAALKENTLVKEGKQYSLDILKNERERIVGELKREGYFYFLPDYLYFRLDSASEQWTFQPTLKVKGDLPEGADKVWHINHIYVHHDTVLYQSFGTVDTVFSDGLNHVFRGELNLEKPLIRRFVYLQQGQRYDEADYRRTVSNLTSLGVFKYIQLRFSKSDTTDGNFLDAHLRLVQQEPKSLRAELRAVTKSNDFAGPGLDLSYVNRNVMQTASTFMFTLNSGFETQISSGSEGLNNIELGTNVELDIPRFIAPGFLSGWIKNMYYDPKTRFGAGFNYFNRSRLYTVKTIHFSMDYHWKTTSTRSHQLTILSLDYQRLQNVSDRQEVTRFLQRNYPEQFISSFRYTYNLNNLLYERRMNHLINFTIEPAGNVIALVDGILNEKPSEIFGIPYARYARLLNDTRLYWKFADKQKLAGRLFLGVGVPYGNTDELPYKKQFYSGGTTSLRAFQSRSVGPGTYEQADTLTGGIRLGQTGDLKLETNLEYRFGIVKWLKGAVFMDAGNIWLFNEDDELPGSGFQLNRFAGQLAAGGGLGIRLDVDFFVLRLDVAMPFRKPYLPEGDRWVLDEISFSDQTWRQENIVFNVALGYPF